MRFYHTQAILAPPCMDYEVSLVTTIQLALIATSVNQGSVYYQNLRMRRSLVKLSGLAESVTKVVIFVV